jgi:hypothetical protein
MDSIPFTISIFPYCEIQILEERFTANHRPIAIKNVSGIVIMSLDLLDYDMCCIKDMVLKSIVGLTVIVLLNFLSSFYSKRSKHSACLKVMQEKKQHRDKKEHKSLSLEPLKDQYPIGDAHDLVADFQSGKRTFSDFMLHCIKRTNDIGKTRLVSVTDEVYDEAFAESERLDAERSNNGKYVYDQEHPLAGVPISIKDCFIQKGTDCTLGISARCFKPAESDGLLVGLFREAGAIPFVK